LAIIHYEWKLVKHRKRCFFMSSDFKNRKQIRLAGYGYSQNGADGPGEHKVRPNEEMTDCRRNYG
jgi:hypothetical protein